MGHGNWFVKIYLGPLLYLEVTIGRKLEVQHSGDIWQAQYDILTVCISILQYLFLYLTSRQVIIYRFSSV